jgi:GH24 family phage-related lysozyme (muramidase)
VLDTCRDVEALVETPLTDNQFGALVSFTFNLGRGNLAKSTLLRKLNGGDYDGAAIEFNKWNKAGGKVLAGLVARRAAEAELFQTA